MAHRCGCCRRCSVLVPSIAANTRELMPVNDRLRELNFGTLTDAAGVYDEEGLPPTTALEFIWWLRVTAQYKSGIIPSGRVLTAADRRW